MFRLEKENTYQPNCTNKDTCKEDLKRSYIYPGHPIAFSGIQNIVKYYHPYLNISDIEEILSEIENYTLHKEFHRPQRNVSYSHYPLDTFHQSIMMGLITYSLALIRLHVMLLFVYLSQNMPHLSLTHSSQFWRKQLNRLKWLFWTAVLSFQTSFSKLFVKIMELFCIHLILRFMEPILNDLIELCKISFTNT